MDSEGGREGTSAAPACSYFFCSEGGREHQHHQWHVASSSIEHLEPTMALFDLMGCNRAALRVVQGCSEQEKIELKALIIAWDAAVENMNCQGFAVWVDDIMMNMSKPSRKSLSHRGAVRVTRPRDEHVSPCWTDARAGGVSVRYFDAGNLTYARAAQSALLWGRHDQPAVAAFYNDETWGDIIECGLALAFDVPDNGNISFRDRLEALVLATMDLTTALSSLVLEAKMWAYTIDEIRLILL